MSIREPQIDLAEVKAHTRRASKGRNYGAKHPELEYQDNTRITMLNLRRLGSFRYDIRDILAHTDIDEALASAVVANVIAKASRVSIADAKTYVREIQAQGGLHQDVADDICSLLDRYSKYR